MSGRPVDYQTASIQIPGMFRGGGGGSGAVGVVALYNVVPGGSQGTVLIVASLHTVVLYMSNGGPQWSVLARRDVMLGPCSANLLHVYIRVSIQRVYSTRIILSAWPCALIFHCCIQCNKRGGAIIRGGRFLR